jgi:hypothetical protein
VKEGVRRQNEHQEKPWTDDEKAEYRGRLYAAADDARRKKRSMESTLALEAAIGEGALTQKKTVYSGTLPYLMGALLHV